jgi:hypothetical protein
LPKPLLLIIKLVILKKLPITEGTLPLKPSLVMFIARTFAKSGPVVAQVTPWLEHQVGNFVWSGHDTNNVLFDQTVVPAAVVQWLD